MKIEKLPSGNYRCRIVTRDASGKRKWKSITAKDKDTLRRLVGEFSARPDSAGTVVEAIDAFLADREPVISPATYRGYVSLAKQLKSRQTTFCASQVVELTPAKLQRVVNDLVADGCSPKTIRNYHGFLSAVWKHQGRRLPAVRLPQLTPSSVCIPDEETVTAIMESVKGTRLEIPLSLAMFGLRRSEICALSPDDLDGDVIHVHAASVLGADNEWVTKAPKTYTSDRYVRIPHGLAEKIRDQGQVTDMTPRMFSHAYERHLARHGFDHYRLHDLRHFFVSYCHNVLHLPDAQIQSITGHKTSVVMRAHYLHSMRDDAASEMVVSGITKFVN